MLAAALVLAACSTNVTESDEYLALADERDQLERERDLARDDYVEAQGDLDSIQAELADSEARVKALDAELAAVTDALLAAQVANESPSGEPWPESVRSVFIEGCAAEPDPDLSPEDMQALCVCVTDELEQRVSLSDFLVFSVAFLGSDGEFPADIDEEFLTTVTEAGVSCALSLGAF